MSFARVARSRLPAKMDLSVLFFGDVVGEPGRDFLAEQLPLLREKYKADLVVVNAENATHGHGLNTTHYKELKKLGIDVFTMGDHIWNQQDLIPTLEAKNEPIMRPANYSQAPGKAFVDVVVLGKRVRVLNLVGRVFMRDSVDNAFRTFDEIIAKAPTPDLVIVDYHAEATSEKRCFAEYVDGRAQLVVGTHTHVPTADAQVLSGGTAFISDLGMVGPQDSSLGADKFGPINNFLTGMPWRYTVAPGAAELGAVHCIINVQDRKATSIQHIRILQ